MSNTNKTYHQTLRVNLPDLSQSDLIDILRVLQAFSDALLEHHKNLLVSQAELDRQIALFETIHQDQEPLF